MTNFWKKLKPPILALAPMAGIADSAFRQLCKKYGADVVYTEMTSADGLHHQGAKTLKMLEFNKSEKPIVCQLFGKRPETFVKAAQLVETAGFNGIDINFGCPARKVVGHGGGVTLMQNLPLCREIIKNTISATKIPVSIKIRTGYKNVSALNLLQAVSDLDIKAVMIHGRTYEQGFSGLIDCEIIKKIKTQFKGTVLANGGINTPEDAAEILKNTNADGLGLARGLYGRPWLFQQIKDYLKTGQYKNPTLAEIKKIALAHATLAQKSKGDHGLVELRKHLLWYTKGLPNAKDLRAKLVQIKSISELKKILAEI